MNFTYQWASLWASSHKHKWDIFKIVYQNFKQFEQFYVVAQSNERDKIFLVADIFIDLLVNEQRFWKATDKWYWTLKLYSLSFVNFKIK